MAGTAVALSAYLPYGAAITNNKREPSMNQFDPCPGRRPTALLGASLAALLSLPLHAADVDGQRIANADAEPGNWMSHGRDYG